MTVIETIRSFVSDPVKRQREHDVALLATEPELRKAELANEAEYRASRDRPMSENEQRAAWCRYDSECKRILRVRGEIMDARRRLLSVPPSPEESKLRVKSRALTALIRTINDELTLASTGTGMPGLRYRRQQLEAAVEKAKKTHQKLRSKHSAESIVEAEQILEKFIDHQLTPTEDLLAELLAQRADLELQLAEIDRLKLTVA